MALILKHQTKAELIARFREAYRLADKDRLARMAKWLLARVTGGDLTQLQVRNAFGLDATQWDVLKTKMLALIDNYDAVQEAEGE